MYGYTANTPINQGYGWLRFVYKVMDLSVYSGMEIFGIDSKDSHKSQLISPKLKLVIEGKKCLSLAIKSTQHQPNLFSVLLKYSKSLEFAKGSIKNFSESTIILFDYIVQNGLEQASLSHEANFLCGAVIIHNQYLLTAAHCINRYTQRFSVKVGILNESDKSSKSHSVEQYIVHPLFKKTSVENDIAILKLKSRLEFNEKIQPICLPKLYNVKNSSDSQYTASGFGFRSYPFEKELYKIEVRILTEQESKFKFLNMSNDQKPKYPMHLCVSDSKGLQRNNCYGDSGRPLSCFIDEKWQVYGLVSLGDILFGWDQQKTAPSRIFEGSILG
ncbi:DgyrCDS14459 [Dimorphilus gyrociliatus]|uniref:DgyrCDS14459 n=1 Tax=Dimorphilus gyrociliatus TaxID=2664684 RepID=A0A7I8WDP0_9ANNE|nr:DgyrCDS14459 [Dimorphilus gyrociliatus]